MGLPVADAAAGCNAANGCGGEGGSEKGEEDQGGTHDDSIQNRPPKIASAIALSDSTFRRRPQRRIAHHAPVLFRSVINYRQQYSVQQVPQHDDAPAEALTVELAAKRRGPVDQLTSQQITPLQQSVEDHAPLLIDVPSPCIVLRLLRLARPDVGRFFPEE